MNTLRAHRTDTVSLAASLLFHVCVAVFFSLTSSSHRRIVPQERIIPINMISVPSTPPDRRPPPPAVKPAPKPSPPAPAPPAPRPAAPRVPTRPSLPSLDDQAAQAPLLPRMESPFRDDTSLKEKVQSRLPEPPAMTAEEPELLRRPPPAPEPVPAEPRAEAAPLRMSPRLQVESANFPHAWYVAMVQAKIYDNWTPPSRMLVLRPDTAAAVSFRISRSGAVAGISLHRSSGYTLLDRSALGAVRELVNLPPLPADYREEFLNVVVTFQPVTG